MLEQEQEAAKIKFKAESEQRRARAEAANKRARSANAEIDKILGDGVAQSFDLTAPPIQNRERPNAKRFRVSHDESESVSPTAKATFFQQLFAFYAPQFGNTLSLPWGTAYNLCAHYLKVMGPYSEGPYSEEREMHRKQRFRNVLQSWRKAGYQCDTLDSFDAIFAAIDAQKAAVTARLCHEPAILFVSKAIGESQFNAADVKKLCAKGVRVVTYKPAEDDSHAPFEYRFLAKEE
jgi:hypothetical protein